MQRALRKSYLWSVWRAILQRWLRQPSFVSPGISIFRSFLTLDHELIDLGFKIKRGVGFWYPQILNLFNNRSGGWDLTHGKSFGKKGTITPGNLWHLDVPRDPLLNPGVETLVLLNGVPCLSRSLKRVFRGPSPRFC